MTASVLEAYKSCVTSLTDLPDDVLFQIFSFLPLRGVLQIEHICQRIHQAITGYLSTLKRVNLYHHKVKQDIFRHSDESVILISPTALSKLLTRCKVANSIVYLPPSSKSTCRELVTVIGQFKRIIAIEFVDSKGLWDEIQAQNVNVTLCEVRLSSILPNLVSSQQIIFPVSKFTSILFIEDANVDSKTLTYCQKYMEISLVRCQFEVDSTSELDNLKFSNLSKFMYAEKPGRSASSRIGALLVKKATESKKLEILQVGLSEFSALETALSDWKATNLEHLEIVSTGSYSASLQQLKYASIVANICHLCRDSLKRVSLPSSILIKRFFTQLISNGSLFKQLITLQMTGIADTKMFLSPGNLVETLFYQEFLKLCPLIASLSLHSYTGSLISLMLPLTLTELILPWDNRLNLEKQKNEIVSCLTIIPQLKYLSILGVEEVDALLQDSLTVFVRQVPTLHISIQSLLEFRLKNVCIWGIDLTDCTSLTSFSLQCCPTLKELSLPIKSLKKVCIYDDYVCYIDKFMHDFVAAKSKCDTNAFCHVHIQLHSVIKQEPDAKTEHQMKGNNLFSIVKQVCTESKDALDFLLLKDNALHLFEHNSGEPLYPFTEFQLPCNFISGRSDLEIRTEISRRECILEGLNRWKACITDVKSLFCNRSCINSCASPVLCFDTTYCECEFKCATNIQYLKRLNALPYLCQSSALVKKNGKDFELEDGNTEDKIVNLHVPYVEQYTKECVCESNFGSDLNANPLIFISIAEYAHNIYTLFYYD